MNNSVKVVKVWVPSTNNDNWEIPYLDGRWECIVTRYDQEYSGSILLQCSLKDDLSVRVLFWIACYIRDTKQNWMKVSLSGKLKSVMIVECEILFSIFLLVIIILIIEQKSKKCYGINRWC